MDQPVFTRLVSTPVVGRGPRFLGRRLVSGLGTGVSEVARSPRAGAGSGFPSSARRLFLLSVHRSPLPLALPLPRSPRNPPRLFRFFFFQREESSVVFLGCTDAAFSLRWMTSMAASVRVLVLLNKLVDRIVASAMLLLPCVGGLLVLGSLMIGGLGRHLCCACPALHRVLLVASCCGLTVAFPGLLVLSLFASGCLLLWLPSAVSLSQRWCSFFVPGLVCAVGFAEGFS